MATTKTRKYSSDPAERARELVAEGKIGGQRAGAGRPRKSASEPHRKRAATVIAERAREVAPKMASTLVDVLLSDDATRTEKMRAVKVLTGIEGVETDRERDEIADPSSARSLEIAASGDEAKQRLAQMLADPVTGGRLRAALADSLAETGIPAQNA